MKGKEKREDAWLFSLLTFFCVGSFPKQRVVINASIPHNLKAWLGQLCKCSIPGFHPRNKTNRKASLALCRFCRQPLGGQK